MHKNSIISKCRFEHIHRSLLFQMNALIHHCCFYRIYNHRQSHSLDVKPFAPELQNL
ncbi:hypothetical protein Hanom_Chr09g00822191 [Helianthus anomalus]